VDTKNDISDPLTFLEAARPFARENRFILGTFERGVTVYRQQIRALNLVYSLVEARNSNGQPLVLPGSRVTVIGGGAFGTTVAAAAAYAKFRVVLLERHQTLLHLQRGCDTRWLHPRFYDWPAPESESQMARLPFLDWTASSAGHVAVQIQREIADLENSALAGWLKVEVGVPDLKVEQVNKGLYEVRYRSNSGQYIRPCEIVIYAVGFGIESNHGHTDSYWRNDRFGQSDLSFTGKKIRYIVSGFGDGGLVDVFRLTIRDFRYERIFGEMFSGRGKPMFEALNQIRKSPGDGQGSLYDKFVNLEQGNHKVAIGKAKQELNQRLRSDTAVILNGKAASFRLGLSMQNQSFSNALLAFLLFRLDAIKYKCGSLDTKNAAKPRLTKITGAKARPEWLRNAESVIIRHGTDRESALRAVDCGRAIKFLRSRSTVDSGKQIYPAGWWGRYVEPDATSSSRKTPAPVEYVPPLLRTHATTFVSTLASILRGLIDTRQSPQRGSRKRKFRVTLHRLTQFDGKDVFQQVTPYKGRISSEAGVGRFFPVQGGIVGIACRTGSLVVARRTDPAKFSKIWELTELNQSGAKNIKPYVDSLLCCPFFAPESGNGVQHVILALFVDSADPGFFDNETLQTISFACRGFVDLLESFNSERMLRALPAVAMGYRVQPSKVIAKLKRDLKALGVSFVDASDKGWKEGLTFKTLRSLDLQVSYQDPQI
jgi:hypothetical protein